MLAPGLAEAKTSDWLFENDQCAQRLAEFLPGGCGRRMEEPGEHWMRQSNRDCPVEWNVFEEFFLRVLQYPLAHEAYRLEPQSRGADEAIIQVAFAVAPLEEGGLVAAIIFGFGPVYLIGLLVDIL